MRTDQQKQLLRKGMPLDKITDAKRYLLKIRRKKYRLDELNYEKYLEQNGLILKAQDLTKPLVSGSRHSDLGDIPIHIEDYIEEINREEKELYKMKRDGKQFICLLPDELRQTVLLYFYIDFLDWPQIARRMHFSESYIYSLHASAILYLNDRIRDAYINNVQVCMTKILNQKIKKVVNNNFKML